MFALTFSTASNDLAFSRDTSTNPYNCHSLSPSFSSLSSSSSLSTQMSHLDPSLSRSQPTRAGPQRTSSLDPAKTAKLLQKKPKHSKPDPAASLERKRDALNQSLSKSSLSSTTHSPPSKATPLKPTRTSQARAAIVHNMSAPELHQPDDVSIVHGERPSSAPLTSSARSDVSHPPLSNRRNSRHLPRQHKLDRIDELDESNPLGISLHHGGPYEAAMSLSKRPTVPEPKPIPSPEPKVVLSSTPPKPTEALPAEPQAGASLHLLPGQILPNTILRSYQSQSTQYTHFAPPRIQLIHNQQQHVPLPPPVHQTNQMPFHPDFDPYAQFPLGELNQAWPFRNNFQAPHKTHRPPRLRDQKGSYAPQRNMGPRMVQPAPLPPMLAMPTPQRPPNRLAPFPQFDPSQNLSTPVIPPGLTLAQHMQPKVTVEEDAFAHLPAGILRMNTPSPPPAEPERNPLLTPLRSTFDTGANLVRRSSLPLHAPQRAAAPPPNPVDLVFHQVKQTTIPSVASAPTIAPFYQTEQSASHSKRSLPSSHSYESFDKLGSEESSTCNTQLPTPPDKSPKGSRLMKESYLHRVEQIEDTDMDTIEHEHMGLPTPESTPSPRHSPEREPPRVLEPPTVTRVVKAPVSGQSPVLADYMAVRTRDRHHGRRYSEEDRDSFYGAPAGYDTACYARGEVGHEPPSDEPEVNSQEMGQQRSVSTKSLQRAWSQVSEVGHGQSYRSHARPPLPPPPPPTLDGVSMMTRSTKDPTRHHTRHAPKNLVMPTPLARPNQTVADDLYQEAYNAAASLLFSPPLVPQNKSQASLVQSQPSSNASHRNVLKKRTSAPVAMGPPPPNVPLAFPMANMSLTGLRSTSTLKLNGVDGQRAPRRLSKKRTDF